MKRASLVGPLLLIALGVLFLARNLHPEFPLAEYLARYWPYILIAWGALRIAEICYWALSSQPLPARGVSGGEWVLVVFLCVIGMAAHGLHDGFQFGVGPFPRWWTERVPWAGIEMMGAPYDYPVNAEKAASRQPRVVIEDFRGDLEIIGSDTDQVKITGRKSIRALDKNRADEADRNSAFELSGDPDYLTLRLREGTGLARISSALEVTVPKGAMLEARRRDGAVRISKLEGAVSLSGRSGNVDVHDVAGPVSIEEGFAGNVVFKNLTGAVRFKTPRTEFSAAAIPGEVDIDAGDFNADGLTGPTRLMARSRDVRIRDFRNALDVRVDRGDLNLEAVGAPLAPLQATVRSGNVNLVLPEHVGFSMKATTKSGEISTGLGAGFKVDSERRGAKLEGATGTGPGISIEVERGDISVRQGSNKLPAKDVSHPLETINQ